LRIDLTAPPASPASSAAAARHVRRVNRAIDHIRRNLAQPLSLPVLAAVAGFSPFHFHRVFKAFMGEPLNQFVLRLRLERALYLMAHARRSSLTSIALDCGFVSPSNFSRSFKQHFGVAPSAFELANFRAARRQELERVLARHTRHTRHTRHSHGDPIQAMPAPNNPDGFTAKLRDLPARTVAYLRVHEPYRQGVVQAAAQRLVEWA
jgi:AraC family transcriptional regulator